MVFSKSYALCVTTPRQFAMANINNDDEALETKESWNHNEQFQENTVFYIVHWNPAYGNGEYHHL